MSTNQNKVITRRAYIPRPPSSKPGMRPHEIKNWLESALMPFLDTLVRTLDNDAFMVHGHVGAITDRGADIASAATIEVTHRQHSVTGTQVISRIDAEIGFRGQLNLLALGEWTLVEVAPPIGNIASSCAPSVDQLVVLVYDVVTELWYPSIVGGGVTPVIDYEFRGETQLVGTKDGANTTYLLPFSETFWTDPNGKIVTGPMMWKANDLLLVSGAPGMFQYSVTLPNIVTVGTPPLFGDYLAFTNFVLVNA